MQKLAQLESIIDSALQDQEMKEDLEGALEVYRRVEQALLEEKLGGSAEAEQERQRLLAYCLMRQGNIHRQLGNSVAASRLGQREMAAARASGDEITLARSLMSQGTNLVLEGEPKTGVELILEARVLFENGDGYEHQQGLGWSWVLEADLGNAGLVKMDNLEILHAAEQARAILEPIENWPGVARAYAARAAVLTAIGDENAAEQARQEKHRFEEMESNRDG
jgi:hypothetical protein